MIFVIFEYYIVIFFKVKYYFPELKHDIGDIKLNVEGIKSCNCLK